MMLLNYFGKDRQYHNIQHIASCLVFAQELMDAYRDQIKHPEELIQAIIWHDVIYDPQSRTNESDSALQAVYANPNLNHTALMKIILATRHTGEELNTIEEKIMVDIDLRGLATETFEEFAETTRKVRAEYGHLTDLEWERGRSQFYRKMLYHSRIFYTDLFHEKYEESARNNLRQALSVSLYRLEQQHA